MQDSELSIYLASQSPRRRELLEQIGVQFKVIEVSVDEDVLLNESPKDYVSRISIDKATFAENNRRHKDLLEKPVLGADTCVSLNGKIFGKPQNYDDAIHMLMQLSNATHEVYTGLSLIWKGSIYTALSCSSVTFSKLSQKDIAQYLESGEAWDKAGSYAIQGRAAGFISHLQGSYSGVVGLPLYELRCLFTQAGLDIDVGCVPRTIKEQ